MSDLPVRFKALQFNERVEYQHLILEIKTEIEAAGFRVVENNTEKPWGAYFRIDSVQAEDFINDFFPGLTLEEARLGIKDAELSPKILVVLPLQRLSWQYHDRRAERWQFLTAGGYRKSSNDTESERYEARPGDVVQFATGERHRLEGYRDGLAVVAEIWQHTNPTFPSDEDDIVRIADDYQR